MKKSKKVIVPILTAILVCSMVLTACGSNSEAEADNSAVISTAEKAVMELPEGLEWMTPFEDTVTLNVVVGWDADSTVKEGTTPETNSLVQIARDYLNIELNFLWMVPNDQLIEKLAMQLSSGEIPDVVILQSSDFYEFMDSDYLRDLTDAYDACASDELKDTINALGGDDLLQYASKDGKLYGIPAALDTAESVPGLYYRSDWLEALKLDVPTNMQEVNDMLVKFAEYGSTVNGGKTTAGLGTVSSVLNTNFALSAYFQGYGAYPNKWIMRDGELVNGVTQDEMLDALNGLKDLYDRGALAPDFATWDFDQFSERVTTDQVGAAFGTYYIPAWPLNQNKDANPDADWAEIDLAELDGKSKPVMSQVSIDFFNVVTKDAPEHTEEALIKLLNLSLAVSDHSTTDKTIFNGLNEAENGADIFYLPVYMYFPTPWVTYREEVWAAYENKDRESLRNQYEKNLYDFMEDWLENGNDSGQRGESWGMYKSRLTKDMGIALGLRAKETGDYEPNYFYGPATATEQRAGATLADTTTNFVIDYILGQKTEADWEDFKQTWNDLGGAQWTKEVNEQYRELVE